MDLCSIVNVLARLTTDTTFVYYINIHDNLVALNSPANAGASGAARRLRGLSQDLQL